MHERRVSNAQSNPHHSQRKGERGSKEQEKGAGESKAMCYLCGGKGKELAGSLTWGEPLERMNECRSFHPRESSSWCFSFSCLLLRVVGSCVSSNHGI